MEMTDTAPSLLDSALNLFYPPVCQICHEERAGEAEGYVGPKCRAEARPLRPPFCTTCGRPFAGEITATFECADCRATEWHFQSARAAVVTNGFILEVLHKFKYGGGIYLENYLAELLVKRAAPKLRASEWHWIVPVPLHPVKRREREFNQAERLAARLSQATGIPLNAGLVRRVKSTQTQTRLTREQRAENMRRAFAFGGCARLAGERIVLVDDVMTIGATTNACAQALRAGGAGDIAVWTVARGA